MFEIERVSSDYYRLREDDKFIGSFRRYPYGGDYVFDISGFIYQDTNPHLFSFILKTLENLNNGVVYD